MPLNFEQKKAIVSEVAEVAKTAQTVVAAEYRGLNVLQLTNLRTQARDQGIFLKVVPNRLAKLAFADTSFVCLNEHLTGPLILAMSHEEPSAAARLVKDFAKNHEHLKVKALALNGQYIEAKDIDKVAKLPTYDEALSQLMSVMKAPISKFVRTLAEPTTKLVRTVVAVKDQKEAA